MDKELNPQPEGATYYFQEGSSWVFHKVSKDGVIEQSWRIRMPMIQPVRRENTKTWVWIMEGP